MTKYRIVKLLCVSSVFIGACSSPPKPTSIDMSAPTTYFNEIYQQTSAEPVPMNRGDHNGKSWIHQYKNLNREDFIAPQEKVRFFYFVHHADVIDIWGLPQRTERYKYWLKANGAKGIINTYYLGMPKNAVNITFTREKRNEKN